MVASTFKIQGSRSQFRFVVFISVVLCIISAYILHKSINGEASWLYTLIFLFITLSVTSVAIELKTVRLNFVDGYLLQRSFFTHEKVYLPSLVKAERYTVGYDVYTPRLKLQDQSGNTSVINPGNFNNIDVRSLVTLVQPYIFITRVDKNFVDLQFFYEQNMDLPKRSVWQYVRGTFLFILLPCLLLTAAVIAWAIITKQPAFQ